MYSIASLIEELNRFSGKLDPNRLTKKTYYFEYTQHIYASIIRDIDR